MVGLMVLAQRKVLLLAADDFEDMELLYPLYRLAEEDVTVTVAGLDDHPVRGKK
jgi:protease I